MTFKESFSMSAWTCHEITNPLQLDVDIQSLILPTSLGFVVIYSIRETTTRIFIESNFFSFSQRKSNICKLESPLITQFQPIKISGKTTREKTRHKRRDLICTAAQSRCENYIKDHPLRRWHRPKGVTLRREHAFKYI